MHLDFSICLQFSHECLLPSYETFHLTDPLKESVTAFTTAPVKHPNFGSVCQARRHWVPSVPGARPLRVMRVQTSEVGKSRGLTVQRIMSRVKTFVFTRRLKVKNGTTSDYVMPLDIKTV